MLKVLFHKLGAFAVAAALLATSVALATISAAIALFQWLAHRMPDYAASAATSVGCLLVALVAAVVSPALARSARSRAKSHSLPVKRGPVPAAARWLGRRLLDYGGRP
jgi:hypothetical protein